ncbi:type II secretion system protein N [Thiorhodospira sibirica]|uniref:type II secretion system protein N n=1 Tax=Thiorhodospira sibirica TaxID=154347 RepID=UPI00022C58C4|nr:type II secretion system protein N [Thiorhodospira sibirica]
MKYSRQILLYLLLGLASYLLFLLFTLPATTVYGIAAERGWIPETIEAQGLSGTLWSGQATHLRIRQLQVQQVQWQFQPSQLWRAQARYAVSFRHPQGQGNGTLAFRFRSVDVYTVRAELPAAEVARAVATIPLILEGQMLLDAPRLRWNYAARLIEAEGVLGWLNAAAGFPRPQPLGDVRADVHTEDDGTLHAVVRDQNGALGVQGVMVWYPDDRYEVQIDLEPNQSMSRELHAVLRLLASQGPDGQYQLRYSGQLGPYH